MWINLTDSSGNPLRLVALGTNEISKNLELRSYPNPVTDILNFELSTGTNKNVVIELYDNNGKLISKETKLNIDAGKNSYSLNIKNLIHTNGNYVLFLRDKNEIVGKIKFLFAGE